MREVDTWVDEGWRDKSIQHAISGSESMPALVELELEEHGLLISYPDTMRYLTLLLGSNFVFHHIHSDRHDECTGGKSWHHDYEQPDSSPRGVMVHVLYYPNGLRGSIGELVLAPGSHHEDGPKDRWCSSGTSVQPGETVVDKLPAGSAVIVHSRLMHCRRPRAGADTFLRYFVDVSYCQAGVRWPASKSYWTKLLARARELRLDRGQWPFLFEERHFTEWLPATVAVAEPGNGSMARTGDVE